MTEPGSPKNPEEADRTPVDAPPTETAPPAASGEPALADAEPRPTVDVVEPEKPASATTATTPATPVKTRNGDGPGKTALALSVLALLGLAGLGYYAWQNHESDQARSVELHEQLNQVSGELAAKDRELQTLQAEIAGLRERPQDKQLVQSVNEQIGNIQQQFAAFAREQNQQLGQMDSRLNGQQQRLQNLSTTSREDWLMAEAEYLLRLANQRVLLERSPANVIALLESADGIMEQVAAGMGDAELFAIRRAITQDLAELRAVEPVDKEGIYLRLQALADSLSRLPTAPERILADGGEASAPIDSAGEQQNPVWYQRAWQEVKSLAGVFDQYVRIQDREAPAKPLVDQSALQIARLNLRLAIEQAQVAMLREEETIYRQSLARAGELVSDYYQPGPASQEFQQQLQVLAQVDIAPELPDISEALKLLHGYIESLHRTRPQGEGQSS